MPSRPPYTLLGQRIDPLDLDAAVATILGWAEAGEHRYVCVSNVHMVMEGHADPGFRAVVNGADLITPDGMPLVWALRLGGERAASRVRGPDLMPRVLAAAAERGIRVGFVGGAPATLDAVQAEARRRHPALDIACALSPPFRPLTAEEDAALVAAIQASGARILFVGLGCPKQERWMAAHLDALPCVQLGVGAAFDFFAGAKPEAPPALQRAGLEWLYRLAKEPRRLWRRYLLLNPRFLYLWGRELARDRVTRADR